jgi:hypothetical protein
VLVVPPPPAPPESQETRLRREAKTVLHLMTHLPMNEFCDFCREGKLRKKPARRRRNPTMIEQPDTWGHTLLADHLMTGEMGLSINGDKFGLLLRDVGTDIGDLLATKTKSKLDTVQAIREFGADMRWKFFASDNAPELKAAATFKQMVHLSSTPYRPESNGVIERFVGLVSDGTRCLLAQSGLPHTWWPYAARAFCHARNVSLDDEGESPWHRKHGTYWTGPLHAFGMKVIFRKPAVFQDGQKFAARGAAGIFLGWHLWPGGVFRGDMLVIAIDELALKEHGAKARIYRIKEVRVPALGITFPLRVARMEAQQRMLMDKADDGDLDDLLDDPDMPDDVDPGDEVEEPMDDLAFEQAAARAAAEEAEDLFGPEDEDEAPPGEELLELEDAEPAPVPARRAPKLVDLMDDTLIESTPSAPVRRRMTNTRSTRTARRSARR